MIYAEIFEEKLSLEIEANHMLVSEIERSIFAEKSKLNSPLYFLGLVLYPCFFFFMLGWIVSLQFLSSFLIEHFIGTKTQITITFVSVGVGWCLGNMWLSHLLVRFFQPKKILFYGLLLSTTCLFIASGVRIYLIFFHFMLLGGIFASLAWTNCLSLISMNAPNYMQGKILGVNQSIATLSMTFAPLFGGFIGQYDIRTIYLFASTSVLLSFLILITFKKSMKIK